MLTILGPTASGKTRLAVSLAHQLHGEIISADSRQVYCGMDIGTGKDLGEYVINGHQIPFHLIDIANPGDEYNVYTFQKDFLDAYQKIVHRNKIPVLCGGTGLYLESVLLGYKMKQVPVNKILRSRLEDKSLAQLVDLLKAVGPLHNTTDMTDRMRCIRAIEIRQFEKEHPDKPEFPQLNSLNIGIRIERQELRDRITRRLKKRLENGMIEEVKGLLSSRLNPEQLLFYGLEYRFVTEYIMGKIDYNSMFSQLNTAIHQLSKRQMTWFRRMGKRGVEIHWIDGLLPEEEKVQACLEFCN